MALISSLSFGTAHAAEVVTFPSGGLVLRGVLYTPSGNGPFPAALYNHGSAPGMLSAEAFDAMVHLLETDHLQDQMAALAWLRKQRGHPDGQC